MASIDVITNKSNDLQLVEKMVDDSSMYPIKDVEAYKFYTRQRLNHWDTFELNFCQDSDDYQNNCTPFMKRLIDTIFFFFLIGDGLINNNLIHSFLLECKTGEETSMFIAQAFNETIHQDAYGLMSYTIHGPKGMVELRKKYVDVPYMQQKVLYFDRWTNSSAPKCHRLLAFACAEGIFFSVLFAIIFWFRSKKLFKGVVHTNELIARDETLHRDWACFLFKRYGSLPEETALEIVLEAVNIEKEFVTWMIGDGHEDLSAEKICTYVEVVADVLLEVAGYKRHFNSINPYTWLGDISLCRKNNFYEIQSGNYSRASLTEVMDWESRSRKKEKKSITSYVNPEDVDF